MSNLINDEPIHIEDVMGRPNYLNIFDDGTYIVYRGFRPKIEQYYSNSERVGIYNINDREQPYRLFVTRKLQEFNVSFNQTRISSGELNENIISSVSNAAAEMRLDRSERMVQREGVPPTSQSDTELAITQMRLTNYRTRERERQIIQFQGSIRALGAELGIYFASIYHLINTQQNNSRYYYIGSAGEGIPSSYGAYVRNGIWYGRRNMALSDNTDILPSELQQAIDTGLITENGTVLQPAQIDFVEQLNQRLPESFIRSYRTSLNRQLRIIRTSEIFGAIETILSKLLELSIGMMLDSAASVLINSILRQMRTLLLNFSRNYRVTVVTGVGPVPPMPVIVRRRGVIRNPNDGLIRTRRGQSVHPQQTMAEQRRIRTGATRNNPFDISTFDRLTRDALGRIRTVTGRLRKSHLRTGTGTTRAARTAVGQSHDAGHLRSLLLGGRGGLDNTFPQWPRLNRGHFARFEGKIARILRNASDDFEITFSVQPRFNSNSTIPSSIIYYIKIPGRPTIRAFFDNVTTTSTRVDFF